MVLELGFGSLLLFGDTDLTWFQAFVSGPVPVTGFVAAISEVLALKQYHRLLEKNVSEKVQAVHGDPAYLRFHSAVVVLETVKKYYLGHLPSKMSEMVLAHLLDQMREIDVGEFETYFELNVGEIKRASDSILSLTLDYFDEYYRVFINSESTGFELDDTLKEKRKVILTNLDKLERIYSVFFSYILKKHSQLSSL